ncbi:MAG: phosphoribosylanthranilate isomerase [Oscillospiraceae bacterium]
MSTLIKLCGMFREEDIAYANEALPDFIGFIINFPKSHRSITPERASELKSKLDPRIKAVGVFVNSDTGTCAELASRGIIDMIQLHGAEDAEYIARLRTLVSTPIIKAVKVAAAGDIKAARALGADRLLLDNGTGTGRMFDHSLIDEDISDCILAGGLTPENVAEVIRSLHPYAVDMSGGIETDRIKDRLKMLAAVNAARSV